MKTDVVTSDGILKTGKESLLYWKKSMDFKKESLVKFEQELRSVYELVKKVIEKVYAYLKDQYTESHVDPNKQLVYIEWIKSKFLEFIEEMTSPANFQDSKILELSKISMT